MKKILVINGHPDRESYCYSLSNSYIEGAKSTDAEVRLITVNELSFQLNLEFGYRKRVELEPCLVKAQEDIKWAEHIVLIYPVWWGSTPAILKGFFDRVLLPGFAFKKKENSPWWDKYLIGKSARIISTMDQPPWYYWLVYGAPSIKALKKLTFEFCGISPVKITSIGPIRNSKDIFRSKWFKKVYVLGSAHK